MEIPNNFYRVSVKALIVNDENEFLLAKEANGYWELLGGGLDFGEDSSVGLKREILEETGLETIHIDTEPSYFLTSSKRGGIWVANIIFKVTLANLDFKASDECVELRYFNKDSLKEVDTFTKVIKFANLFYAENLTTAER